MNNFCCKFDSEDNLLENNSPISFTPIQQKVVEPIMHDQSISRVPRRTLDQVVPKLDDRLQITFDLVRKFGHISPRIERLRRKTRPDQAEDDYECGNTATDCEFWRSNLLIG